MPEILQVLKRASSDPLGFNWDQYNNYLGV